MSEKSSATIEDYLETLYILQRDGVPIVGARIAELLRVTPPTVTNTLKRMSRDGLIAQKDAQGYQLTRQGQELARSVMRRHMLTEWLLMNILKVPWSKTHSEAHNLEHNVSEMLEEQMRANLGDPQTCPHGNPMPGFEHVTAGWISLDKIGAGEAVIIRRVHELGESDPELMRFLEENKMTPGAKAKIAAVLPFNQTITLMLDGRSVSLGFSSARFIYVEKVEN